jgi:hypothetical protein
MQIHLFDCKSSAPLRRGLGKHKLDLCLLVLQQLRNTYWSASVTYRLFARAQALLDKSNSKISAQAEKPAGSSHATKALSNSRKVETVPQQQQQQLENREDTTTLIPDTNFAMNEQTAPYWLSDSPSLNNVDQLLSPGFIIPETSFQSFFTGYENGMIGVYDQTMPVSSDIPMDLLYRS